MYRLEVKQKERKKRFRPTDDVTFIYDDEYDNPTRKIINEDKEYKEYCALWGEFIQLLAVVRWRNKPVDDKITRIRIQIEHLKTKKTTTTDPLEKKNIDAKLAELTDYEVHHVKLWKAMDNIIADLSKNNYVKRRNLTVDEYNKTKNDTTYVGCRMYQEALYDMIYP